MNKSGIAFLLGAALGSIFTYVYTKRVVAKKIEEEATEKVNNRLKEIDKINEKRQAEAEKREKAADEAVKKIEAETNPTKESLEAFAARRGYYDYTTKKEEAPKEEKNFSGITVYETSEEFARSKYDCLTYYYDGEKLIDEGDNEVNKEFLGDIDLDELFGESDVVRIRNDVLECDYEIEWREDE